MTKKVLLLSMILFAAWMFFINNDLHAEEESDGFNPNNIISDREILDYTSMDLAAIQKFLENKNSFLASYTMHVCTDADVLNQVPCSGPAQTTAEVIYDRALANKINPKFILVLLQKEQSLIEEDNPSQKDLDWACGYGCFDGMACNPRWQGLWKQINSATLQFRDYMDNSRLYTYQVGGIYNLSNPYAINKEPISIVSPANLATAALYNYTPHVYNGNYNFYKLWQRYFSSEYPDGSLLQADGEVGVWLIQNGEKRPFLSKSALLSRFDQKSIIKVSATELGKYPKGAPIKFPQYSVVASPIGDIYLLVDNTKKKFANKEVFRTIGINPEEVIDVTDEDLSYYQDGEIITSSENYPSGALLQDKTSGGVYFVMDGKKAPLIDKIFLKTKFKDKAIIKVATKDLDKYEKISPVILDDGMLIKAKSAPSVYVISNGQKRPIASGEDFVSLGYKWENILEVPDAVAALHETGEMLAVKK